MKERRYLNSIITYLVGRNRTVYTYLFARSFIRANEGSIPLACLFIDYERKKKRGNLAEMRAIVGTGYLSATLDHSMIYKTHMAKSDSVRHQQIRNQDFALNLRLFIHFVFC